MADAAAGNGGARPKGRRLIRTLLLVIAVAILTSVGTVWLTTVYLFPRSFEPVTLSQKEQAVLDAKLQSLNVQLHTKPATERRTGVLEPKRYGEAGASRQDAGVLKPERYSEAGASREVSFSEREINALIATNTDLASKVAIDLSTDMISAKVIVPIDPDMPMLGGKTLRITAGLELRYKSGRPVVVIKGVSLWGVPVPNAWLGNLKNVDLVHEYGDEGFWRAFGAGIDNISVSEGRLTIKLKE